MTYSCKTEKTRQHEDGNTCVYITKNKLSKWNLNNEAVNICSRRYHQTTVHVSGAGLTLTHIYLWGESDNLVLKEKDSCFSTFQLLPTYFCFFCFLFSFSLKACRYVALQKKTGGRPPALVSKERHARKTKTCELYKHHSRKNYSEDHP